MTTILLSDSQRSVLLGTALADDHPQAESGYAHQIANWAGLGSITFIQVAIKGTIQLFLHSHHSDTAHQSMSVPLHCVPP